MRHLSYAGMLVCVVLGTAWLEPALGVRVYARWRRLLLTVASAAPLFLVWDLYAVAHGHWSFDRAQNLGVELPGGLPLEEVLFFLVVPLAAVMTLEAVRAARGWPVGDEPASPGSPPAGPP